LATGDVDISVRRGRLIFKVGGNVVEFAMGGVMSQPMFESVNSVDILEEAIKENKFECQGGKQEEELEAPPPSLLEEEGTSSPKVDLKPLPPSLEYAFIDDDKAFPVIINANLMDDQKQKLMNVLKEKRKAIGYSIDDLTGIDPRVCMHRIKLEDGCTPPLNHKEG